jgi:hypothetical protein
VRAELKLHLVKKLVNFCMKILDKFLPEKEPYYPQTKMLHHVFEQLFQVYRLEVYQGMYDDVPYQTVQGLKDRNFQRFLSVTRKLLLFVGENDRYYRAWIGLGFKLIKEEYERAAGELTQEEFLRSYLEQWELKFPKVHLDYFESNRSEFLDMMLASYLPNLLRMKITIRGLPQSKEQKEIGG